MPSITGFTADYLEDFRNNMVNDADISDEDLILKKYDLSEINVGNVKGLNGSTGSPMSSSYGTYTPTLVGMDIGTGGGATNTATYTYLGGTTVGDHGIMLLQGDIVFGTTGATLPSAAATTIQLPNNFNFAVTAHTAYPLGVWVHTNASWATTHPVTMFNASRFRLRVWREGVLAGRITISNLSSTLPTTWAAGQGIKWEASAIVVRV